MATLIPLSTRALIWSFTSEEILVCCAVTAKLKKIKLNRKINFFMVKFI
jgi:hypothetical protein